MKNIIITAAVSILLGLGAGWFVFHSSFKSETSNDRKILYYRDPMNPQITSSTPKKSSDGMDFVPVYAEASGQTGQKKIAYYKDPMHPWYTSDKPGKAPDCGMEMVPVYEGESDTKGIKIDPVTIQNIGVKTEVAENRKLNKTIRATGKVDYDETKVYSVTTKVMGYVEQLYVDYTGKTVHKGEVLMDLYSPELVTTQQEYLQAIHYQKELEKSSVGEARKGAEELVQSAKRRLLYWDIPESEINALEERGTPKKTMTIVSPVDGIVMEKMVLKGQNVMAGMTLYKIVDLSTVWILADVYQFELPWLKVGQPAKIELSYLPGKAFSGTVSYIFPYLNMETKTVQVRIQATNTPNIEFKPEMYVTVTLSSPLRINAVTVSDQAIIRSGERNIIVVALGGGYFDPRDVTLGVTADGYTQVLDGIHAGENIVTSSQFLIDSESNLKAAIDQMKGHEGMDMSKPMEGKPDSSDLLKGQVPKKVLQKKKASEQKDHDMNSMPDMDHKGHTPKMSKDTSKSENHKVDDMKDMPGMDHNNN